MSDEEKKKHAKAIAKYMSQWPRPETSIETALYRLLNTAGMIFFKQKQIGRYVVDAFVPIHNLVFEADHSYWHQDISREEKRDSYLIARGVTAVIHLSEGDLV